MKRLLVALTAAGLLAGLVAAPVAAGPPFTHVTGSVGLSTPSQYVSFNAFDYGDTGDRGTVNYTNFDYPVAGTGVWNVGGTYTLLVNGFYAHTMTVTTVTPISTTASLFSGTGVWLGDLSYTWTVTGSVTGSAISFHILYTGTGAGYWFDAIGTIAPDGSMSGTGTDSLGQTPLTWSTAAGSVHEVFSYTASVYCAVIGDTDATFGFLIPTGVPYAGTSVVVTVHDGGTPGTNGDTWGHAVGTCGDSVGNYPITSGNLVVH